MWTVHLLVWRTGVSRNRYGFYGSVCRVSISKVTFPIKEWCIIIYYFGHYSSSYTRMFAALIKHKRTKHLINDRNRNGPN